ncbi:MAG: hypothetical protein KF842_06080 [Caulobacter sp.]|nr:hypothetical protein [Caulobacter sp.]
MSEQDRLMDLERGFWEGDENFFRRHVADHCLLAFTGMAGVKDREAVARSTSGAARWTDLEVRPVGEIQLSDEAVIVTYEASARREGEPYRALVSSGYVRRGGDWKLAFHQQTPMEAEDAQDQD